MNSKSFSRISTPETVKPTPLVYSGERGRSERPMLFIHSGTDGKLKIGSEALRMLQSLEEHVAIVSVCGRARQGKSSLINQLLEANTWFEFASTTNGVWLWSPPLWGIAPDGTSYDILLLDTQSIDANYPTERKGLQMISLAVLLSSILVYNQMGSIDDVALHLLYRIIEMTKHIHLASQGTDTTSMLEQDSPILLFLLRDFHLGLLEDNHVITPKEYLEHTVGTVEPGGTGIAATRSKMRESIRGFFPDRGCCTLVHPTIDENDLGQLDRIPSERLRPEFRDGLARLKSFVLERAKPKQVGGAEMTGPILLSIAQTFLDVVNKDDAPYSWMCDEEAVCLKAYCEGEGSFLWRVNSKRLDEVSKEFLEQRLAFSVFLFHSVCRRANLRNGPLREIYLMCLKSTLEKKIVELMKAAAERVTLGNIANERPDEAHPTVGSSDTRGGAHISSIRNVSGREIPELSEDHPGLGAISFGLRSRRKKPHER